MARRASDVVVLRRHGIVLVRPLSRAVLFAAIGAGALAAGWPFTPLALPALAAAVLVALRSVWRWERTRIVVTDRDVSVREGTLRRRTASAAIPPGGVLEVEQTLLGGMLGYGTLVVGELGIPYVPRASDLARRRPGAPVRELSQPSRALGRRDVRAGASGR